MWTVKQYQFSQQYSQKIVITSYDLSSCDSYQTFSFNIWQSVICLSESVLRESANQIHKAFQAVCVCWRSRRTHYMPDCQCICSSGWAPSAEAWVCHSKKKTAYCPDHKTTLLTNSASVSIINPTSCVCLVYSMWWVPAAEFARWSVPHGAAAYLSNTRAASLFSASSASGSTAGSHKTTAAEPFH